ncbi:hypothetical protein ACTFIY_003313 [Dictyostelium cf. discoideum]
MNSEINYYFNIECPLHWNQICYFFCYTCRTQFCGHCSFSEKHPKYQGHKVADLKEEVKNYFLFSGYILENSKTMKSDIESIHNNIKNSNDLIRKELTELQEEAIININEYFQKKHQQINQCDKSNKDILKTFFQQIDKNISKLTQLKQMGIGINEQEIISQFGKYYEVFSNENNLLKNPHFEKCEITKLNEIKILNNPISVEIKNFEYKEEFLMKKQYLLHNEEIKDDIDMVLLAKNVDTLKLIFPRETKSIAFFDDKIPFNGDSIKSSNIGTLNFCFNAPSISKDTIPKNNIHTLYFTFGYNKFIEPGVIPDNIKIIHFGNIGNNVLVEGSIPNTVETIHFHCGFNLKLEKNIIPNNIITLHFYDVKNILKKGSIPELVTSVNFHDGFENDFDGFLLKGCPIISVHNITSLLPIIHEGKVDTIFFHEGFDHTIEKNQIPEGVKTIHFNNIRKPLIKGSIPKSAETIILENGYNQPLPPFIIPNKVNRMEIGAIQSKLEKGCLPESLENLQFKKGFNQIITKDLFLNNNKLISVEFGDILKRIELDSLPQSLKELKFASDFSHPIPVIPENVIKLSFVNIKSKLPQTIPKNVQCLTLQGMDLNFENGFLNSKLEYLTIIGSSKKIIINKNSIPKDIKYVTVPQKFVSDFISAGVSPGVINKSYYNKL